MTSSLLDIAPQTIKVAIGQTEIECHGITAAGVAQLMERFPGLRSLMFPDGVGQVPEDLTDPLALIHAAPGTIAAILAAGTGHAGDEKHEAAAAKLPIEPQLDLLTAILKLTLPGGIVPFIERVTGIFRSADDGDRPAQPNGAMQLSDANGLDGKGQDTSSPSRSAD